MMRKEVLVEAEERQGRIDIEYEDEERAPWSHYNPVTVPPSISTRAETPNRSYNSVFDTGDSDNFSLHKSRNVSNSTIKPILIEFQEDTDGNRSASGNGNFNWRDLCAFVGPGFLVCVAYIDPGNVEADLQAGSKYGYMLLWVLLYSTIMGIILQFLTVKLALVTGMDLARACRDEYPKRARYDLYLSANFVKQFFRHLY